MMWDVQDDVEQFHDKFGVRVRRVPQTLAPDRTKLRIALLREEYNELVEALAAEDMVGTAKEICDLIYVAVGTAVECGINLEPVWLAVHASNMRKVGGATRADGKIMKPDGWEAPQVKELLLTQRWMGT